MAGEAVLSIVLEGLLSKLKSPILDEFGLLWGVKNEKQKLQSNLSRIKAVLQDAERQQIDLMTDKDRLGKLKDVAYDSEDLVDEFLVEALRRKVENQDGMGRKVGNFFSPSNPLAFHFKIAHKMKELRKRFQDLAEENNNIPPFVEVARSQPQISNPREAAPSVPDTGVIGRVDEKGNLIDSLLYSGNEEVLSVIPIVGMGGLGKTTLAQYVYDDKRVVSHFNLKMWVYVSEDFDVRRILAKILESASQNTPTDGSSKGLLITLVKANLSGKRYLLVLDDVWNEVYEKWDELRTVLKCGAIGSKILVTTRSDTVARRMDALPRPPLETLSAAESWTLFEEVAHPPPGFVSIGEEIVRKCGGVPLAIKTLGGMLLNEPGEGQWQSVRDSELWKTQDHDGGILPALRLSYDHLTSSLKQCFAYCAVVPKGRRFYKEELIKQWIAQGFIHSDDENDVLLEEKGEEYFNALLRRSLFQVDVEPFSNDEYKMHDLIHDLLRSIAGKECLVVEASMMNDLTRHLELFNGKTRHLAFCFDDSAGEPKNLDALKKCNKLRSMITARSIDINVCLSFRCLRVLDLSCRNIDFLPNSIDKLRHLRYFDISYTSITELPETICNLHNLQTLRVLSIPLQQWPKNMKRMISLRHIEFEGGDDFPLPKGMGKLTFLRTLPKFIIAEESGAQIEELKDLNLLMGNISIEGLENIRNGACASEADLKAKKHLHSLHLCWNRLRYESEGNAQEVINNLEPPSNLKKLVVSNYRGLSFPSWMMMLSNLVHIKLWGCIRCEQLPPFGQLPLLESLEIYGMSAIKYIVKFDGSHNNKDIFRSLRHLVLSELPNLERWSSQQENGDADEQRREEDEQVILGRLCRLRIHDCRKLIRLPKLLLPALEFLEMKQVGCDRIDIPMSKSLKELMLGYMPNLERWSDREVDDDEDEQVIFRFFRTLNIFDCPKLIWLPRLFLPALESLHMNQVGCDKIEFSTSQSLERVGFTDMPNLEMWSSREADDDQKVIYPRLRLEVENCPKMVRLPHLLPSLEKLSIAKTDERLLGSLANYTSLVRLDIRRFPEVMHLPEEIGPTHANSLHTLEIYDRPKLISLSHQLKYLHSLKELKIYDCPELVLPLLDGSQEQQPCPPLNSLKKLEIYASCEKQRLLPGEGMIMTSLEELRIRKCGNLESLSSEGLQNLTSLEIEECPKVWSSPEWLRNLTSLKKLEVVVLHAMTSLTNPLENLKSLEDLSISSGPDDMTDFPEWIGNLASLTYLRISDCPSIRSLPESFGNLASLAKLRIRDCPSIRSLPESFGNLASLTYLRIYGCPSIRSLPESFGNLLSLSEMDIGYCPALTELPNGLQRLTNLRELSIWGSPDLERRLCKNWKEWKKVAHVPEILIDCRRYSWEAEHPSLMQSLKKGCNKFDKKLHFPTCASSSSSP